MHNVKNADIFCIIPEGYKMNDLKTVYKLGGINKLQILEYI